MNPSSVPLHPRPSTGKEGQPGALLGYEIMTEGFRVYPMQSAAFSKINAYQAIMDEAWSLSDGKRFFDLVVASVGLVIFLPLMLVIAFVVGISSPGPVLFTQRRMGRWGALFTIYKFRTMVVDAENGPSITVQGDSRITPVGALLRRFKLDELPQLVNVIKGDMSFVGPRPKLPHHESLHMPFRPGITGAATLAFRCEEELLRRVPAHDLDFFYARTIKPLKAKLDWEYMQRATCWTDLGLLWCTATACLGSENAPAPVIGFPEQA